MTTDVQGPAWALEGLGVRSGKYPLAVEGPVMRAVDRLVPGVSTVTRYIRYHSLYAAVAARAEREGLDLTACRRLVRRCETLMAALPHDMESDDDPWFPHGVDRVRIAERDVVSLAELEPAAQAALGTPFPVEQDWLTRVLTATDAAAIHTAENWAGPDRTRRAAFRILGRAIDLYGHKGEGHQETLRSAVAFGEDTTTDPVLAAIPETAGWRGLLLRHYSVGAWRRLWAALVSSIGSKEGEADRTAQELRDWLAQQAPEGKVRELLEDLPSLKGPDGLLPAERELLEKGGDAMVNVRLLLVGALRSREGHLPDDVRAVFLGRQRHSAEFLDPTWVDGLIRDYSDRPVHDLAARLVDDMLAQSRRVALAKLRTDPATGGLKIFSRLHVRNERYFKTGDEGDSDIGTRIPQLGSLGRQLGLFDVRDGCHVVTASGRMTLETER
ncbi:hypothetical protein LZP81_07385 [Streptomyces parvulus]|uniref:hypothetical protein n=1 Tax=Streptomyces parvulus TaxID=146923 RepID=UPI001E3B43C1|nr:hypothetical protein [Streptomyces parvulus]MCC9153367.1 hypothetical protein [Streptomyces parvulus]MCE7686668.1 hypothetical protein [Streptomyces parvulus]